MINSSKFVSIAIKNWGSIDLSNILIICPYCVSNSLSFLNCGEIYLRNFISSLTIDDLVEP